MAVYCAEWFKREFNGYDLENNALEDIGLIGPGIAQEIFCRAYGEENVCHAGNHREMALVDVCAGRSSGKLYRAEEPE